MNPKRNPQEVESRSLTIQEVRLVSDLRIMHAKVDEIYEIVKALRTRHDEAAIVNIPLALLLRYTTGLDFFWLVVLSATYVCFALTLFSRR
jgi:hypothetical protein